MKNIPIKLNCLNDNLAKYVGINAYESFYIIVKKFNSRRICYKQFKGPKQQYNNVILNQPIALVLNNLLKFVHIYFINVFFFLQVSVSFQKSLGSMPLHIINKIIEIHNVLCRYIYGICDHRIGKSTPKRSYSLNDDYDII